MCLLKLPLNTCCVRIDWPFMAALGLLIRLLTTALTDEKCFELNQAPSSTAVFCHYYFIFFEQITEGQQAKQQPQIMLLRASREKERMRGGEKMVLGGSRGGMRDR